MFPTLVPIEVVRSPSFARRFLALLLILAVAAGLRLWQIDSLPPGFHFDESFEGLEAWRILTEPGYKPIFLTGNFGVPPLNAYANALMFALFQLFGAEAGPTAMRTTAALFGLLGVLVMFMLGEEMRRRQPELTIVFPFFAALVLAIMRWHLHFSRMGIEPIIVPLEWTAANWLLLRGWRSNRWPSFAALGAVLAACLYTYQGAWVIPLLVALTAIHLILYDRRVPYEDHDRSIGQEKQARWRGLVIAAAVALILVLPLAWFFVNNNELLFLRPGQVAIAGDEAATGNVWQNAWASVRMFFPVGMTGDLDPRRNLPGAAALNIWLAVPFAAGFLMALWRIRKPVYSLLIIGLVGLLIPGMVSEYAPHFHRVLGAAAPTAMLIALPLAWILEYSRRSARLGDAGRWLGPALIGLILLLATATSARNYFVRWAALPELFHAFDEGLWELGQWISDQPPETPVYLTPRDADHATLAFAWRPGIDSHGPPVSFDGRYIFPLTANSLQESEQYAVIEHEDFRTRLLLPEVFPEASVLHQIRDAGDQVYARVYERPAGAVPERPPQYPVDLSLGDGVRLAGYDLVPDQPQPGEILYLQLHWLVESQPEADWTVFSHVVGPAGGNGSTLWAGSDSLPGHGSLPTGRWQPGWRILDEYQIALPEDMPPATYDLEIGLYTGDGDRLPVDQPGFIIGNFEIAAHS